MPVATEFTTCCHGNNLDAVLSPIPTPSIPEEVTAKRASYRRIHSAGCRWTKCAARIDELQARSTISCSHSHAHGCATNLLAQTFSCPQQSLERLEAQINSVLNYIRPTPASPSASSSAVPAVSPDSPCLADSGFPDPVRRCSFQPGDCPKTEPNENTSAIPCKLEGKPVTEGMNDPFIVVGVPYAGPAASKSRRDSCAGDIDAREDSTGNFRKNQKARVNLPEVAATAAAELSQWLFGGTLPVASKLATDPSAAEPRKLC